MTSGALLLHAARQNFGFLTSEYEFSGPESSGADPTSTVQLYTSSYCQLSIELNGTQVYVHLKPPTFEGDPSNELDLFDVVEMRAPAAQFGYAFDPDGYAKDPAVWLDAELGRLAGLVRVYCSDMLAGDFSVLGQVQEFKRQRQAAVYHHSHD